MPRKSKGLSENPVTLRLPADLLRRADALVPALGRDGRTAVLAGMITRSVVLRLALAEGLQILEARHRPPSRS
jgi:hypothetical protein